MSKSKKIFAFIMFTIMLINTVFSTPKIYAASKDKPKWTNSPMTLVVGDKVHKLFFADKYGNAIPSKYGKWSSGNKKIATVSKHGVITAKKKGRVRIKIKYHSRTYKIKVTVITKKTYEFRKKINARRKAEEEAKKAKATTTEISTEIVTSTEVNTEQSTEPGSTEMENTENTVTP